MTLDNRVLATDFPEMRELSVSHHSDALYQGTTLVGRNAQQKFWALAPVLTCLQASIFVRDGKRSRTTTTPNGLRAQPAHRWR